MLAKQKLVVALGAGFLIMGAGACATQSSGSQPEALAAVPLEDLTDEERKTKRREALRVALLERQTRAREEDPVMCETETVTGSRLIKGQICARASDRSEARSLTRLRLEELHRRSSASGLNGGG